MSLYESVSTTTKRGSEALAGTFIIALSYVLEDELTKVQRIYRREA